MIFNALSFFLSHPLDHSQLEVSRVSLINNNKTFQRNYQDRSLFIIFFIEQQSTLTLLLKIIEIFKFSSMENKASIKALIDSTRVSLIIRLAIATTKTEVFYYFLNS